MSRATSFSPHQMMRLNLACEPVARAWGDPPYLVGSAMRGGVWRDVDVRTVLTDEEYDERFLPPNGDDGASHHDPMWVLICTAVSEWLSAVSGLPVDYQIQRQTEANSNPENTGRCPLGLNALMRRNE